MHVPPFGALPTTAVVSIETAGDVLGIGRSTAYRQGNDYIASGGTTGIPCFRLAGVLRVPTWALLELALKGRLVRLCDIDLTALLTSASPELAAFVTAPSGSDRPAPSPTRSTPPGARRSTTNPSQLAIDLDA